MQLRNFITDDDAVSPVIGVILMVAITVILAAVIATFVLGLGDSVSSQAPQASFDFNPNAGAGNTGQITMTGGDKLDGKTIKVTEGGNTIVYQTGSTSSPNVPDPITAGTNLLPSGVGFSESDTVRVIWTNPNGGNTAVIGAFNA